jgi:hypothetical protein
MNRITLCAIVLALTGGAASAAGQVTEHLVATDIRGGYQVVAADPNKDSKIDLIGLGSQARSSSGSRIQPEKHVIINSAPHMINMDVANLDGDIQDRPRMSSARGPLRACKIAILTHNGDRGAWTLGCRRRADHPSCPFRGRRRTRQKGSGDPANPQQQGQRFS